MHSVLLVSDYIIYKGGGSLTPMQIIKLAYIGHGFSLAITGNQLFTDRIEAWKYGPVIPVLYHALKHNRSSKVTKLYYCRTPLESEDVREKADFIMGELSGESAKVLDMVMDAYGHLDGNQLSFLTHAKDTPWAECYKQGRLHTLIPDAVIQRHYERLWNNGSN